MAVELIDRDPCPDSFVFAFDEQAMLAVSNIRLSWKKTRPRPKQAVSWTWVFWRGHDLHICADLFHNKCSLINKYTSRYLPCLRFNGMLPLLVCCLVILVSRFSWPKFQAIPRFDSYGLRTSSQDDTALSLKYEGI